MLGYMCFLCILEMDTLLATTFGKNFSHSVSYICFYDFLFFFFLLFRVACVAYGIFQARGQIRAAAASLPHSHNNGGSKLCL